jgi:hypothetical protein
MGPYGDSTVYISRIGDRHLGYMKTLRSYGALLGGAAQLDRLAAEHSVIHPLPHQGLTLVHQSAQRTFLLGDTPGNFSVSVTKNGSG